jgi:hypothetical protein
MKIGTWLFTPTNKLSVSFYYPYSKKRYNDKSASYIFQPYFGLDTPSGHIILHGKRALWSLLDSLFPDDPLPRTPVNNDLKDATLGKQVIDSLLQDPTAWPHLRLQIRDGDWFDHQAHPTKGTFCLSSSPSASETDITPNLLLLEREYQNSYSIPLTFQTRTRIKTVPAIVITLPEDANFKVVVMDSIGGNHVIFSVIEKEGSGFRPQRHEVFPVSGVGKIAENIGERLEYLSTIFRHGFVFPQLKPLDSGMRFTERDDLEFRRFQSCNSFSSLNESLKE